jgi:hypothetical protein
MCGYLIQFPSRVVFLFTAITQTALRKGRNLLVLVMVVKGASFSWPQRPLQALVLPGHCSRLAACEFICSLCSGTAGYSDFADLMLSVASLLSQ